MVLKSKFSSENLRNQRNLVSYVMEVIFMLVGLVITLGWLIKILFKNPDDLFFMSVLDFQLFRFVALGLAIFYLWELVYRLNMNWQLILHHIVTIILIVLLEHAEFATMDLYFFAASVAIILTAFTEPLVFVALFMYRLGIRRYGIVLKTAAIQTGIFKVALSLWAMVLILVAVFKHRTNDADSILLLAFHGPWYTAWKVLAFVLFPLLICTQIYGCYIMWIISSKTPSNLAENQRGTENSAKNAGKLEEGIPMNAVPPAPGAPTEGLDVIAAIDSVLERIRHLLRLARIRLAI